MSVTQTIPAPLPRQACMRMTLGLSFRLWQLWLLKIWKIVSSWRIYGCCSLCFVPQIPSRIPCDINTKNVLSEDWWSWWAANCLSAVSISRAVRSSFTTTEYPRFSSRSCIPKRSTSEPYWLERQSNSLLQMMRAGVSGPPSPSQDVSRLSLSCLRKWSPRQSFNFLCWESWVSFFLEKC